MDSSELENRRQTKSRRRKQPVNHNERKYKTRSERHRRKGRDADERIKSNDNHTLMKRFTRKKKNKEQPIQENEEVFHNRKDRKQRKGFALKLKHLVLTIGAIIILALTAYTIILYGGKLFVDESKLVISAPTTIETTDGTSVWQLYDQYRQPVELEDIPEQIQGAFIATEDKRFYSHSGVDFRSIMRAIYKDIIARSKVEGASTITQQLAKNLFLTNDKTWLRKTKEIMIALYLEREFTKDEILEMYLNAIYFGQGSYGIEAAANKFFNNSADELALEEIALLAGIVNAPNGYSPIDHPERAIKRRNLVLQRMYEEELITEKEMTNAQAKEIKLELTQRKTNPAYQSYVDLVIREAEDKYGITAAELKANHYKITTALRTEAQKIAYKQFSEAANFPNKHVEGAFVMMDEEQGGIAAAIGGRHYQFRNLNRVVQMKRQPGSVMKPLAVYGPAMELDQFHPYMMLPDEKQEWDGKEVRNYDDQYAGSISLYDALVSSKNTSAVWLLNEIGIDYAKSFLTEMDMKMNEEKDGLNIALGGLTNGLSPMQLVEGFRTFAHGGEMVEAHTILSVQDAQGNTVATAEPETNDVFSPQVAWNMTEMLMEVVNRGTGQAGSYPHQLAGKTGTTQENHDIWFVGYTPEYVTALWMGYDNMKDGQQLNASSSYPTKLTKKILSALDKEISLAANFEKPDGVQALAEPIELPEITDLTSTFVFGGFKILKGKLEWPTSGDDRVIYRIYEKKDAGEDELIGEVTGAGEYVIDEFVLFQKRSYYVVPYDPLGDREGTVSNIVDISF